MCIRSNDPRQSLAALKQFFFVFPGKLEEKFLVLVRLSTGTATIVAIAGCQSREEAKAQAISELMQEGYLSSDIVSCEVYSSEDLEFLGRAAESFTPGNQA